MPTHIGQYDQYYLSLVAVVGTIPAVIVLLWLTQRSKYAEFIRSYRGIAPNFLSVIGVLFALNLAFLANDTWSAHDRARHAVFQEAGSLRSILALAEHLPDPGRSKVDRAVRNYTHSVVSADWPMLALRQNSPAAADDLNSLLVLLSSDEVASVLNTSVQSLMLQQAVQARSMRDLRIALSHTHVNPLKWLGMAFLGFLDDDLDRDGACRPVARRVLGRPAVRCRLGTDGGDHPGSWQPVPGAGGRDTGADRSNSGASLHIRR